MNSLKASQFDQNQFIEAIKNDGYCVVEDLLDAATVKALKEANKQAIHKEMNYHGSSDYQHYGVVQCCPMYGEPYLSLVENRQLFDPFDLIMGEGSIIYVYITSSMPPNDGNFSSRIHVDRPRLFPNYCECLAGLIMLDDFTAENLIKELRIILDDEAANHRIRYEMGRVREMLGNPGAHQRAAEDYLQYIVKISGLETS